MPILHDIRLHDDYLTGWIIDTDAPDAPLFAEVKINNRPHARLLCGDRVDWRVMGMSYDELPAALRARVDKAPFLRCGFRYHVPDSLPPSRQHKLEVAAILRGDRTPLLTRDSTFAEDTINALKDLYKDLVFAAYDRVALPGTGETETTVEGWFTVPDQAKAIEAAQTVCLSVNGTAFPTQVTRAEGPVDPLHFTFWPDRPCFRFTAQVDLSQAEPTPRGYNLTLTDTQGGPFTTNGDSFDLPTDWADQLENAIVPPVDNISRTTPTTARRAEEEGETYVRTVWLFGGHSDFTQIERACKTYAGRDYASMKRTLDWGSGCGRMTRVFGACEGLEAHGIDIDPDNVAWSQANLPMANFRHGPLDPPLPYEDGFFDLVTGLSVYTHLTEEDQFAWLAEHRRVLSPGGVLAVTIASRSSFKRGGLRGRIEAFRALSQDGIVDTEIGNKFVELLRDRQDYYRNTMHTHDYIHSTWSRYFDIKAVLPGYASGQQDLVIGVRRDD